MAQELVDPWDDDGEIKPAVGIGGWLWLPLLHLIAAPFLIAMSLMARLKPLSQPANIHALVGHPAFLALTAVIGIVMLARLLFGLLCLLQLFRKRLQLPRMMTVWYGFGIAIAALGVVQFALFPAVFTQFVEPTATSSGIGMSATFSFVISGIFIVYFDVAERVKNTFVRGDAQKGIWRGLFAPADPKLPPKDPVGLGGWLLLPLLQLVVTPLYVALDLVKKILHHTALSRAEMASHHAFLLIAVVATVVAITTIALGFYCLSQFLRRRQRVPRLMLTWYAVNILLAVLLPVQMLVDRVMFAKLIGPGAAHPMVGVVTAIVINAALIAYFLRSRRVKNTFVR
ncbi:MAG: DUF2569 domain-containing protein [Alphaproteobacteria bacterium]|nr:DUF2569 domain-containing protein [Alphaproteobacteria bacterium]MDE2266013.1 DUF2569 domain-containing protein [Alphaproteobacteria bacterium]MDE2501036.1 DUF2569 domain-containing protein [Alphaproteobacteria bacterium]